MLRRYDSTAIPADIQRTPSGGLRIPARIARTGIQLYELPDGSVRREYRPPEEVHADAALASFAGATVTDWPHPPAVTPTNWTTVARGQVGDDVRADGEYVAATVHVQDARSVRDILDGRRVELSCGYDVDLELTPGTTPDGERYDAIQRNIRGNHVTLCPPGTGRAGPEVRLRLDSTGGQVPPQTEETRMKITINGVDYSEINESLVQAVAQVQGEAERQRGRADAAEARAEKAEKDAAEATDPVRMDAAVAARVAFVERVRRVDADAQVEGRSEEDVLRTVLKDRYSLDGTEPLDYLRGLLEGLQQKGAAPRADVQPVSPPETKRRVRWTPPPLAESRGRS